MKFLNIEYRDRFPIKKPVPDLLQLCVDDLGVYNFPSPIADVIHPADPLHRIVGFKCLRDTFFLRQFQTGQIVVPLQLLP